MRKHEVVEKYQRAMELFNEVLASNTLVQARSMSDRVNRAVFSGDIPCCSIPLIDTAARDMRRALYLEES